MLIPVGAEGLRGRPSGAGLRRRDRRAARCHLGRGARHGRAASGGRGLLDLPQPGLRPDAAGRRVAPVRGDVRAQQRRGHRAGRGQPSRHVGPGDARPGVPGLRIAAPRDGAQLRAQLAEGGRGDRDGPTVVRYPKGDLPTEMPALGRVGGRRRGCCGAPGSPDVLLVAVGAMAGLGLEVAGRLADQGIGVTVVDPRWVKPVDPALLSPGGRPSSGGDRRGRRAARPAGSAAPWRWRCARTRASTPRCATTASRHDSSSTAPAGRCSPRSG